MDNKKTITRQQYLDALEVVDLYHRQFITIDGKDKRKTKIADWIAALEKKPSTRLYNALENFTYFEDVNKRDFLILRDVGYLTWKEFCSLANIDPGPNIFR